MDHGVDAVVTGFLTFVIADATGFGIFNPAPWLCVFAGQTAFFLSNLTLLHQGRQTFFTIDIMELQLVMITSLILTSIFSPLIWQTLIPIPNILLTNIPQVSTIIEQLSEFFQLKFVDNQFEIRFIIAFGASFGTLLNFFAYTKMASTPYLFTRKEDQPIHVKNKVPGTGLGALFHQLLIILSYASLSYLCYYNITNNLDVEKKIKIDILRSLLFASCFAFGDIMDRFMITRVGKRKVPIIPPTFIIIILYLTIFNNLFMTGNLEFFNDIIIKNRLYWIISALSLLMHFSFFAYSTINLSSFLDIHPFKVKDWEAKYKKYKQKYN